MNSLGKIYVLFYTLVLGVYCSTAYAQVDLTVTGKLTVNGDSDLCGNNLTIGRQANPADFGIGVLYSDSGNGLGTFFVNRTTGGFAWTRKITSTTAQTLMVLDANGNMMTNGSLNVLPNQTLTQFSSILTMGLGDGRYLSKGAASMVWGIGSSTSGTGSSIALGDGALTAGTSIAPSISLGKNARAKNSAYGNTNGGIAIGNNANAGNAGDIGGGIAIGSGSYSKAEGLALGNGSQSIGYASTCIGTNNIAIASQSYALGYNNRTYGNLATAIGNNLVSRGNQQVVIGAANIDEPTANGTTPVATDNVFVVGNGIGVNGVGTTSNAFTIKWNGDATMIGNATVTKSLTVNQNATVTGNATVSGASTLVGELSGSTARFTGRVRLAPAGGVSMGEFTVGPP